MFHESRITIHKSPALLSARTACAMLADFFFLVAEFGALLRQFFAATMFELKNGWDRLGVVFHRVAPLVAD